MQSTWILNFLHERNCVYSKVQIAICRSGGRKKEEAKAGDDDAELTSYWVDLLRRVGTRMSRFLLVEFFLEPKMQATLSKMQ